MKKRVRFEVSFILPEGATLAQAHEYVGYAVAEMRGALQPPGRDEGGDNPDAAGDPMFCLDTDTVRVASRDRRKRTKGGKLVEAFDEAAQHWGWQSDQGVGNAVKRAELAYNATKAALLGYLRRVG